MSESYEKAMEIYDDLIKVAIESDRILKSAMKYVPISTQAGINLHKEYDSLVALLNKIANKNY